VEPSPSQKLDLPGSESWDRLPEAKRRGVYDAALHAFADHGFSKASMNTLVKQAGISKGSLFQYFRSKQDLFDGVVALAVGRVKSQLKDVRDKTRGEPLCDRLESLLLSGFTFVDAHPRLAKIYFQLLQTGDAPFGTDRLRRLNDLSRGFLEDILSEASRAGELRQDLDLSKIAFLLNAMMDRLLAAAHAAHLAPSDHVLCPGEERDEWLVTFRLFVEKGLLKPSKEESK
jgi:AcrR family transcriptional regulator